jgi:hypothetical protein
VQIIVATNLQFKIGPGLFWMLEGASGWIWGKQSIPDIGLLFVLHWYFSSISNIWQVIHDYYSFKIGPEVVLVARWRRKAKNDVTVRFSDPIRSRLCTGCPLEFSVYVLPFKSYSRVFIWLEIWHHGSKIWSFLGFWPRNVIFPVHATPKRHFLAANRVVWAIVRANGLSCFCCGGTRKIGKVR